MRKDVAKEVCLLASFNLLGVLCVCVCVCVSE